MKRYLFIVIFIFVLGSICFTFPTALMRWQDEKLLEKIEAEEAEVVKLDLQAEMTLAEKIELKTNNKASIIGLVNGKNYDQRSITDKIKEELEKLNETGVLIYDGQDTNFSDITLNMYVNPEDAAKSMLLWTAIMYIDGEDIVVLVDDESGKIINIEQWYVTYSDSSDYSIQVDIDEIKMADMAEKWGEYLGLEFDEDKSGSAYWAYEFLGMKIEDSDDSYIAVYKDGSELLVYVFEYNLGDTFYSVGFVNY